MQLEKLKYMSKISFRKEEKDQKVKSSKEDNKGKVVDNVQDGHSLYSNSYEELI